MPTRDGRPPGGADGASSARLGVIVLRDGDGCVWCGRAFDDVVVPTVEHLVPQSVGGPRWLENEVAACAPCNRRRGDTPVSEWLGRADALGLAPRTEVLLAGLRRVQDRAGRRMQGRTGRRLRHTVAVELAAVSDDGGDGDG